MQTLGVRTGWVFFEHAGSAVAVDLKSGDVTDVFAASDLLDEPKPDWFDPEPSEALERAEILARSALATSLDPTMTFAVPAAVKASAERGLRLHELYKRGTLVASASKSAPELIPVPEDVQRVAASVPEGVAFSVVPRTVHTQLASRGACVPLEVIERMNLFFSRHTKRSTPAKTWAAFGGDAGKAWAERVVSTRATKAETLAETLASSDAVDYDTLKLLPRAFSVISSPHEAACHGTGRCGCGGSRDSAKFPSERAVTFAALGGEVAKRWSEDIVRREEIQALRAAGYDPDAGVIEDDDPEQIFDADQPHVFNPIPTMPSSCVFCLKDERNTVHDDEAVDYELTDISPEDAHYFTESVKDDTKCAVCDQPVEATQHAQAALAAYYANKAEWDEVYAATRGFWEGKEQGLSAAASTFGIDFFEDEMDPAELDLFERSLEIEEEMGALAWERRDDLYDDMAYYGAFSGEDPLSIDQVYVSDRGLLFRYEPRERRWEETRLESTDQIFELDDTSAHMAIRALSLHPGQPVDLREVDPGEAFLMEETVPLLDPTMGQRVSVVTASLSTFAEEYTPEERSANARKQVRDRNGRFAKSGSKVVTAKGQGTIAKIDPQTQQVEVSYADGQREWTPAQDIDVIPPEAPPPPPQMDPNTLREWIKGIPAKPRASSAGTASKATLKRTLQPMDATGLKKVINDYQAMIEEDRRKARKLGGDFSAIASPEASDVAPMYLAVVDEADHQSVLDLLAMTPASTTSTEPAVWRRTAKGWELDPSMLNKMRSSAPPPIVKLEQADLPDVMSQVDAFYQSPEGKQAAEDEAAPAAAPAPVAATAYGPSGELLPLMLFDDPVMLAAGIPGIADTPEDQANVARLKRYWMVGEGGAKVRWNTPGDMTRCMRYLRKYMRMPGMAEGYCAELHKAMTGVWPGDKRNVGMRASGLFTTKIRSSDEVIRYAALVAGAQVELDGNPIPTEADQVPTEVTGAPFRIPILAPVGVRSGDGRSFSPLALSHRELPIPLMWQVQTQEGHDASVIVGRIDTIERGPDGSLIEARGVFDVGPYGKEAERLVRHKFLRGVSVDLDEFEAEARPAMPDEDAEEMGVVKIRPDAMTITNGRVMGATLVAKPAFQEVTIELDEFAEEVVPMADGTYVGTPDSPEETEAMVAAALTAAGIPLNPPKEWFDDPQLKERTPLTIQEDGRVFGHIATWDVEHIGLPFSTTPPKSKSGYAYFHTGVLRTAQGVDVPVGQITLAGGHADLHADAAMAVKHYDDTASAMCDVHAGEDRFGIWVAGALRPSVTGEQIRAMRAAAPSGDWRPINGRLEMVAVCQVNVPGFPTVRARVASGHVYSLVAAGTSTLNRIRKDKVEDQLSALLERVDALEAPQREAMERAREAAIERVNAVRKPKVDAARERFASLRTKRVEPERYGPEVLSVMVEKGAALRGRDGVGVFAIADRGDLKRALRNFGTVDSHDRSVVRLHITKRAQDLGATDLLPSSWSSDKSVLAEDIVTAATAKLFSMVAAGGRYPDGTPWNPSNHPRDEHGRFRQVIARLRADLEGETGTAEAMEKLDAAEHAEEMGDVQAAETAAKEVLMLIDKLGDNTMDEDAVEKLRTGYTALAEAVANLPLQMGDLNQKFRFTDLPEDLQGLIEDLVKRADERLEGENLDKATGKLEEFMAGGDVLSQPDISAELTRVLRFLI